MRKWIVPQGKGFGLVAEWHKPLNAICEAPDNFTDEMNDYFRIKTACAPDGKPMATVYVDPAFFANKESERVAAAEKQHTINQSLVHHINRHGKIQFHNSLKPHQRFAYSLLGDSLKDTENKVLMKILNAVFGDGVYFNKGGLS